jgi:hypothetical protein
MKGTGPTLGRLHEVASANGTNLRQKKMPWCSHGRLADEDWLGHNAVWFAIHSGHMKTVEVLEALMAEQWLADAAPYSRAVRLLRSFGDEQVRERKVRSELCLHCGCEMHAGWW